MKEKFSLDLYDMSEYPKDMRLYLKNFGPHFNKALCTEAVKYLKRKNPATGKEEPIEPKSKEEIEQLLSKHNIKLENNELYDFVWVYNMLMSDNWKSSIDDELHLCKAVKDMIDDVDHRDGFIWNRWLSDRMWDGNPVEWSDML